MTGPSVGDRRYTGDRNDTPPRPYRPASGHRVTATDHTWPAVVPSRGRHPARRVLTVDACFAPRGGRPTVTINAYATLGEVCEQKGFANLKEVFRAFREPTAHVTREAWPVSEADALDLGRI